MTLISAPTLSVSEFAALVSSAQDFAPLAPCPRSASPELRGAPLRRMSGAPSSPRARVRSPSPTFYHDDDDECELERVHRCDHLDRYDCRSSLNSRRSSASAESTMSSAFSEDEEDEGIIWFGRRTPRCSFREEQFWNWVEDAEPPAVKVLDNRSRSRSAAVDEKKTSAPPALWSRLFVLWRVRRRTRSTPRSFASAKGGSHRRMATCP